PSVAHVEALDGMPAGEVLRLAAAVEQLSSHHLGRAVAEAGRTRFTRLAGVADFAETPGRGVSGQVEGRAVCVGSVAFLEDCGVTAEPAGDGTTAYVAIDGRVAGSIAFADQLRHQVPALMQRLAVLG